MSISIIVPIKLHGLMNLRIRALFNLLRVLKNQDLKEEWELILVTQNTSTDVLFGAPLPKNHRIIQLTYEGEFNKAWCINVGVNNALYENIAVIDSDILFGVNYISFLNLHCQDKQFYIGWEYLICEDGKDNPFLRCVSPSHTMTAGGVFGFRKGFFKSIGMMNEVYEGYGGEDNDIFFRVSKVLREEIPCLPYALLHQYHDWSSPNEDNSKYTEYCRGNPEEVTSELLRWELGDMISPCKGIKMGGLKID